MEDNGPGIPKEAQEQIFKKGFSTKEEEGHGMGLYIVSSILDENGGKISLNSSEGMTVFAITFEKGA